jgi:hypothetical protein
MDENIAKSLGFMPHDGEDYSSAMAGAWENLGNGKNPNLPNTTDGKLIQMYNSNQFLPGWSSKNGFSFRTLPTHPGSTAAGVAQGRLDFDKEKEITKQAHDMAVDEEVKKQQAAVPADVRGTKLEKTINPKNVTIEPDAYLKYVPLATALVNKDMVTFRRLFAGLNATTAGPTSATAGALAQTAMLQKQLDQKSKALKKTSGTGLVLPNTTGEDDTTTDPAADDER